MKTKIAVPQARPIKQIEKIAVFGGADIDPMHPVYQEAFLVARRLAYLGKTVVNGGGPGVMEASTKGAESVGGKTVAVTFYPVDMPEFEGRSENNQADIEIKTANYIERMFGLIDQSDAFICMYGGTGTLSEWATVWLLAHLYYGNHKPIILYGRFWQRLLDAVNENFLIGEKERQVYKIVNNLQELERALQEFEQELAKR